MPSPWRPRGPTPAAAGGPRGPSIWATWRLGVSAGGLRAPSTGMGEHLRLSGEGAEPLIGGCNVRHEPKFFFPWSLRALDRKRGRKGAARAQRCRRRARNPPLRSGRSRRLRTRRAAPHPSRRRRCSRAARPPARPPADACTGRRCGVGSCAASLWLGCRCLRATRSSTMSARWTTAARSWQSSAVCCYRMLAPRPRARARAGNGQECACARSACAHICASAQAPLTPHARTHDPPWCTSGCACGILGFKGLAGLLAHVL